VGLSAAGASASGALSHGRVTLGGCGLGCDGGRAERVAAGLVVGLGDGLDADHLLALVEADDAYALGVAARLAHLADARADDLAAVGDHHELVVLDDEVEVDDVAVALAGVDRDDALAAAALRRNSRPGCACRSR
jgi:hypothetical protein